MKTHEFSRHLMAMAKILKSGPDVEMSEAKVSNIENINYSPKDIQEDDMPQALNVLVKLNEMGKSEWIRLIEEYNFDIDIRSRDATRDIIGKLLNYLSKNPKEREKLKKNKFKNSGKSSSELEKALSILLG